MLTVLLLGDGRAINCRVYTVPRLSVHCRSRENTGLIRYSCGEHIHAHRDVLRAASGYYPTHRTVAKVSIRNVSQSLLALRIMAVQYEGECLVHNARSRCGERYTEHTEPR